MFLGACVAFAFALSTRAAADDGPSTPVTPPIPRAAPVARGFVESSYAPSFSKLIDQAKAAAGDLTKAAQSARAVAAARSAVDAQLAETGAGVARSGAIRDRMERETLIAAARPLAASMLSEEERGLAADASSLVTELLQRREILAAEQATLTQSGIWSLPSGDAHWILPVKGQITQPFGPTRLRLEPPRTVDGVTYAHFHDGVDIAAPMFAPVVAAAPGQVIFVGHLADGAEIVLIAHVGGYVSEYGHLDDRAAVPVRAGDLVQQGQVIGRIGLTGLTTGPHLHFQTWHGGVLTDPLTFMGS
jgi:murein DD-endopeptidase MepM/ murein hydrolase activator NlpD